MKNPLNNMGFLKIAICGALALSSCFIWASSRDELVRESQRRQKLKISATEWFEVSVLEALHLDSIQSFGVAVREPQVTLPPSLGGPKDFVKVLVSVHFSGWMASYRGSFARGYRGLPDHGFVNCRFEQKLWAHVQPQSGRPTRIVKGQRPELIFYCASPRVEWPTDKLERE